MTKLEWHISKILYHTGLQYMLLSEIEKKHRIQIMDYEIIPAVIRLFDRYIAEEYKNKKHLHFHFSISSTKTFSNVRIIFYNTTEEIFRNYDNRLRKDIKTELKNIQSISIEKIEVK